jgi:hypothetical protein
MKATDLMLGDWVLCDGEPYQIAEISAGLLCIDAERELFANPEDLEPIPLTPEILKKNGWEWGYTSDEEDIQKQGQATFEKGWVWDEGAGSIKVIFPEGTNGGEVLVDDQRFDRLLDFIWNEIINTHELQHTLRLCGIEKEIVL